MTAANVSLWSFALFATASGLAAAAAGRPAAATPDPPKVAYVHDGKLHYLQVKDRWAFILRGPLKPHELWHAKMTLEGPVSKRKQFIWCLGIAGDRPPDRWRISNAHFWWEYDHESQGGQDSNRADLWRIPLDKVGTNSNEIPNDVPNSIIESLDKYCCDLQPISVMRFRSANDTPSGKTPDKTFFDVIPENNAEIHAFLAWRGEIRVLRGVWSWYDRDKLPNKKAIPECWPKKMPYIKWDNDIPPNDDEPLHDARPVLRVRTEMREGFFAYQSKTHFFFLTVSGKLYTCRKHGDHQRTELLWNDASSPIHAIIHDTASHKTFAFTKANGHAEKAGRDVFFELAPKLEPIGYDPKEITAWKPADPLPSMMGYARMLLWNVPPAGWKAPPAEMSSQQRRQCWEDLISTETAKAHRAFWSLKARGAETVAFLKDHLAPVPVQTQKRLDQLIADLDSEEFDRREVAKRELSCGIVTESVLRKALADSPPLERRLRLNEILENLPQWPTKNSALLRELCAIRVLQQIGTPEAKALLEKVAAGAPSARLTQKAKDALQSLERLLKR